MTEEAAIGLVFLYRTEREHRSWRLGERARQLHPHRYREIELRPLPSDASQALVDRAADGELPEAVAELLVERAGGNPFFLEEALRDLVERGALRRANGAWKLAVGRTSWPFRRSSRARSRRGSTGSTRRRARSSSLAAVIGRTFGMPLLEKLVPHDELRDALLELQRLDLVVEKRRRPDARVPVPPRARPGGRVRDARRADPPASSTAASARRSRSSTRTRRRRSTSCSRATSARRTSRRRPSSTCSRPATRPARSTPTRRRSSTTARRAPSSLASATSAARATRSSRWRSPTTSPSTSSRRRRPTTRRSAAASRTRPPRADRARRDGGDPARRDLARRRLHDRGRPVHLAPLPRPAQVDRELNVVPAMADNMRVSSDGLEYLFRLREGVRWSDGEPVTAEDFVFAWEQIRDERAITAFLLEDIESATALDDRTLEVRLRGAAQLLPVHPRLDLVLPAAASTVRGARRRLAQAREPRLQRPVHPGELTDEARSLAANPHFVGRARQRARRSRSPSPRARPTSSWTSGATGATTSCRRSTRARATPRTRVVELGARASLTLRRLPPGHGAVLERARPQGVLPRDRPRGREARARLGLVTSAVKGGAIPPAMPGHSHRVAPAYDPELARQLLAEAGYPEGRGCPS